MKLIKIVLLSSIILLIFNCSTAMLEKTSPELLKAGFEYVFELDSLSKEDAFSRGKLWIAESYNSAESVITFEDVGTGVVKGTGIGTGRMQGDLFTRQFKYNLSLYFKDNKTKLVFSGVTAHDHYAGTTLVGGFDARYMSGYNTIKSYFDDMSINFITFMEDTTSDDW
jgi:hypothetical protein